jgi:ATP-dependent Lon protease
MSSKRRSNKDSSEKNDKPSRKDRNDSNSGNNSRMKGRPQPAKRRGHRDDDDDDESVDSKGNIRGLIAYSDEEDIHDSDSSSFEDNSSPSEEVAPKSGIARRLGRRAAEKARKRIQKKLKKEEESERRKSRRRRDEEEEDDEETEEEEEVKSKRRKSKTSRRRKDEEVEEEEEDDEEDEEEGEEDEDDEDDEDDEYDEEEENDGPTGISISFGGFDDSAARMIPKRHNMKKESEIIKKFVKLVTKPFTENTIDDQIDQFKTLAEDKQAQMIEALERKVNPKTQEQPLMFRILTMNIPPDTQTLILNKYNSLQSLDPSSGEYFKLRSWLEKFASVPLGIYKDLPVKLDEGTEKCGLFMEKARRCMTDAIYGQDEAKIQILQFIASKIANPSARGLSLLLVGPPGIGKTSLIKNGIAKALDWPFQFISLGGDSDATTYTGHQFVYEGSHSGKIVNSLVAAKSMSMVLMFDELDKISGTPKGEEVQNMLIHLTDPVQNGDFEDKYLANVPIDLSKVMFVFSGNDINKIDKILLDRMVVVRLAGYNKKEKQAIAEQYLLPAALKEVNLTEKVAISSEVLAHILDQYAGEETGVRELKRCIETIVQKINMLRIFNSKDLPFHIKDFHLPFVVKKDHIDLFLKKKEGLDVSVQRMYS